MVVNNNIGIDDRYSALESFRSGHSNPESVVKPAQQEPDKVEISAKEPEAKPEVAPKAEEPKKKTSVFQKLKNAYASVKKFFISAAEYTVGTVKGLAYGAVAGAGVLGVDALVGYAKRAKAPKVTAETVKKAAKVFSTKGKVIAGVAGLAVLGYQLFQSYLNINEKKAAVDHRWGTGHDQVK